VTSSERKITEDKVLQGARIAVLRLVEKELHKGGELIVYRDGKVIAVKAKDIRLK
jgi:urease accessory protein UreE